MQIDYLVTVPDPRTHLFHVAVTVSRPEAGPLRLCLPVWTPGSYVVREYARHVDDVTAEDGSGIRPVAKVDKATWQVDAGPTVTVRYTVWAYELTVRTSHLDERHGYINGASLFLYPEGRTDLPGEVRFQLPADWRVFAALPAPDPDRLAFTSLDELFDSPIELGQPSVATVTAEGRPHEVVVCGEGPLTPAAVAEPLPALVAAARSVFARPLPYDRYVFFVHQTGQTGGGLEHRASTSIQVPRFAGPAQKARQRLLGLIAHEYFHLWNVKRLHPTALGPFDYQREVYTRHLWLMEGGTSYYAVVLLGRADLVPATDLLQQLATHIHQVESRPGLYHQSLEEASWDAWIKYYRPDAHSPNATVSYYEKGLLACWLIDIALRRATNGRESLDTYLRELWRRYPDGFPEDAPAALVRELGGSEAAAVYDEAVRARQPLDWSLLAYLGLQYEAKTEEAVPDVGLAVRPVGDWAEVDTVRRGGPGEQAGLAPGDRIVALDGFQIDPRRWEERLGWYSEGSRVTVQFFRDGRLLERALVLGPPRPNQPRLVAHPTATAAERQAFVAWLGQPWPFENGDSHR